MQELEKLYKMKDIDQLVEEISAYLQKAIIIENDHFELVAYSSPAGYAFDPVQQKTILAKRCPLYVLERLKKEGIIDRLKKDPAPLRLNRMEDIDFFDRIVISLQLNGRIYGYVWIYETEQLSDDSLHFLADIAPHLAAMLHQEHHEDEDAKQSLIWQLMNGEFLNETEIYQAAKKASYAIPEAFMILVYSIQDARFVHVLEEIQTILTGGGFSSYLGKGTEIIGIIHGETPEATREKADQLMQQVKDSLKEKETVSLYVGVGEAYQHVGFMRKSYLEALEVIETMVFLNISEQIVFRFKNLGVYRYVKLMYKKNVSEQYRNAKLLALMRHDAENKSELLKTLWYYLRFDTKVARTAEALYIHPNTLNYRMKQISQLAKLDLDSMDEKMELYIQLILIHYVPDYSKFYMEAFSQLKEED